MSLAIALAAADGLVLAADSRVTEGYTLDGPRTRDDSVKIVQLSDAWGALTYGIADIGHAGLTALREEVTRIGVRARSLPSILDKSREILERTSAEWGTKNPVVGRRDRDVGFILGGYDGETDTFRTFSLQSPGFIPKSPPGGCLVAGQWHIAKYFLARLYSKELDVRALMRLAVLLLKVTMAVDPQVGGSIRLATVTRGPAFRWVAEHEVEILNRKYQAFDALLREYCRAVLPKTVCNNRWATQVGGS